MPLLDRIALGVTDRMPSMINPKLHAFFDYGTAGAFLMYGMAAWKRDQRVAVASAGCGVFHLLTTALTDYPERRGDRLGMEHHARVDLGIAAMAGTMPGFMGIKDKYDVRFFRTIAVVIAATAGLTDFRRTGENKQIRRIEKEFKQQKAA